MYLHNMAEVLGTALCYHQIAPLDSVLAVHHLPDWAGGINDRRAGWIGRQSS
jgi:hypothetical protein